MSDPIIPAGAFAAMKAGNAQPQAKVEPVVAPKTITRKAEVPTPSEPPQDLTPTEKKIWKLKADGEEFEFDASDEEAVKREIMKARGADKRFESAAAQKKQAETFFEMLKDPVQLRKVLTDPRVGIDLKKFAREYVWEQIQEEQMTPEQKSQRDKDRRLQEYEDKENQGKAETAERAKQESVAGFEKSYAAKVTKALEIGGIPHTHDSVSRMANYLHIAVEKNIDLSPEELVQEVRKDYMNDITALFSGVSEDQLLSLIGEATAEKLRKADLKRLKSVQGNPFPPRANRKPDKKADVPKRLGAHEWKEDLIKGFLSRK